MVSIKKRNFVVVILFFFVILIHFVLPCFADDPCEDAEKEVKNFVLLLNQSVVPEPYGQFKVSFSYKDKDIGEDRWGITEEYWKVTYIKDGKVAFSKVFLKHISDSFFSVSPFKTKKFNGLLFSYAYGTARRVSCAYLVYLKDGKFKAFPNNVVYTGLDDLDNDGEDEIIVEWRALWGDYFAMAEIPYWVTIYHFDPEKEKLIDVSRQFPEYYSNLLEEYRGRYKEWYHSNEKYKDNQKFKEENNNYLEFLKKLESFAK